MEYIVDNPNKPTNSITFFEETGCNLFIRDGQFIISGAKSQDDAEKLIANHIAPKLNEPTVEQKLASVGLSIDDLKSALGL